MDRIETLTWRGLLQDCTDPDAVRNLGSNDSFYVGYDPSAPSLQLGNFIPMVVSLHLARSGLKCIQLFGGATGAIGDPSGRRTERQLLSRDAIITHVQNHKRTVSAIFERAGVSATFVDNYEWTQSVSVLDFLRDVGKHFTVNYMLQKDSVQLRLNDEGMSFTEFSYMLLQAFDFYHLRRAHDCKLQIGGSDQWGNITAGLELIRKKGLHDACALSIPLLLDSQGRKFGKSAEGAIWLDPTRTSPYRFHQFWLNTEDSDVVRYLKIFTFLEKEEISSLEQSVALRPERREAQRILADAVCELVHGKEATDGAKRSAEVLFGGNFEGLKETELLEIFSEVPSSEMARSSYESASVLDLLVTAGLVKSKGEGRRLIQNGGAYLNNQRLSDPEARASAVSCQLESLAVLRSGKKSYHVLKLQRG